MARGIENINFSAVVHYSRVLCQNSNAAFTFQCVRVHNAFFNMFISPENAALFKHGIYKGCFAVVNVGNNCNITQIVSYHKSLSSSLAGCSRQQGNAKKIITPQLPMRLIYYIIFKKQCQQNAVKKL